LMRGIPMDLAIDRANAHSPDEVDDVVFLLGRPTVQDFMQFVRARSAEGYRLDETQLLNEWRTGYERICALEETEGGCADQVELPPLPDSVAALADAELEREEVKQSYRALPHHWSMVEIDRLVVTQRSVNLGFVEDVKAALPSTVSDSTLLELAIGKGPLTPKMRITQMSDRLFSFSSPSMDMRFLETTLLDPAEIPGHSPAGRAGAVLAVFVGFGTNFISAVHIGGRLILLNGTHRLYALRELGILKVPCLVREASHSVDLDLAGASEVDRHSQLYLKSRRPPLFKDYFNRQLTKTFRMPRGHLVLHLQLNMQQWRMPTG
jgi:hypothetical protein